MSSLKIIDAYENGNIKKFSDFSNNIHSALNVDLDYNKVEVNFEWLNIMEDTVRYIDNILRNPNRFIVNEEEIVKVELARRITVESIRHLSKHTSLIQDINEKGEVQPSKILNINKEESFNTYENRFIYTLIHHMRTFLEIKKQETAVANELKDFKKLEYKGSSNIGNEKVNIEMVIDSRINQRKNSGDSGGIPLEKRIEKLEADIKMLAGTIVYKDLDRLHVSLIVPPVKKTNLILKNVNFQYAMRLWDFLQQNLDDDVKKVKKKDNYEDNGMLKEFVNETFLLNYVALNTLSNDKSKEENKKIVEELTNNLIDRIIELNVDMPEEMLKDTIGSKILIARTKKIASLSEIQNTFSVQIKNYLERIDNFRFGDD